MANKTTYYSFIERYIKELPPEFHWQRTPVQIYPLEFLSNYLEIPTPLLQADYHFLILLNSGSFYQQVGIENYLVKSPSVLFVPEGEVFSIKSLQNKLSGFIILLDNKSISSAVSKMELTDLLTIDTVIGLDLDDIHWLNSICQLLYTEVSANKPNRNIGMGLLQAILHKLKDLSGNKKTISRQNEIANSFKHLVTKHYMNQKSVKYYASELSVSENYLNRCVKVQFNKNCKQVIQETTILQSQILMFNTTKDISEISFQVGYDDPSYFSRLFKKITDQTPSEFKKQIMQGLNQSHS